MKQNNGNAYFYLLLVYIAVSALTYILGNLGPGHAIVWEIVVALVALGLSLITIRLVPQWHFATHRIEFVIANTLIPFVFLLSAWVIGQELGNSRGLDLRENIELMIFSFVPSACLVVLNVQTALRLVSLRLVKTAVLPPLALTVVLGIAAGAYGLRVVSLTAPEAWVFLLNVSVVPIAVLVSAIAVWQRHAPSPE